jgi:hypothetical protein
MMSTMTTPSIPGIEHVRPPRPLRFLANDPEWEMGQSTRHVKLCVYLWEALRRVVDRSSTVGFDNFVYFDGADASRKCAPDAFVRLGVPDHEFSAWKTWEDGTPELCVEILSPSDTAEFLTLAKKLEAFHTMGVREVVCFDVDAPVGTRLRAWDRIEGDLVERVVRAERTPCLTLGKWFHVAPLGELPAALAIADDEAGNHLVLPDGPRAEAEAKARLAAEARVRELEELLRTKA